MRQTFKSITVSERTTISEEMFSLYLQAQKKSEHSYLKRCKENGLSKTSSVITGDLAEPCVESLYFPPDCIKEEVINRRIKCQGQQVFPLINGNGSELRAREKTRYYWEITLTSFSGSCSLHRLPLSITHLHTDRSTYSTWMHTHTHQCRKCYISVE